jgi:sugar/nucleoside kinase (ribokinase family)
MFDITGIDMPCIDCNVNVDKLPKPNQGGRVNRLTWQGGGKVASGMVAAARLGMKCAMTGAVGDDLYGRFCIADFQRHGIDTDGMIMRKDRTTSLSVVMSDVETGGRSIMGYPGTVERIAPDELDVEKIKNCKVLFIAYPNPVVYKAIDIAHSVGAKVLIDADGYSQEMLDMIPKVDAFVASEFFYDEMFGNDDYETNCKEVFKQGPEIVVFTRGDKGCVGYSKEGFFNLPAFKVDVVDTVGAGDDYHGAFCAGLVMGKSVEETARLASAVAAIKCTRIGGRAGLPTLPMVEQFFKDGKTDFKELDERVEFYTRGLEHV